MNILKFFPVYLATPIEGWWICCGASLTVRRLGAGYLADWKGDWVSDWGSKWVNEWVLEWLNKWVIIQVVAVGVSSGQMGYF